MIRVTERIYTQEADGRVTLAAAPGDELSDEQARALGVTSSGKAGENSVTGGATQLGVDETGNRQGSYGPPAPEGSAGYTLAGGSGGTADGAGVAVTGDGGDVPQAGEVGAGVPASSLEEAIAGGIDLQSGDAARTGRLNAPDGAGAQPDAAQPDAASTVDLGGNAKAVAKAVGGVDNAVQLEAVRTAEASGKNRASVLKAIDAQRAKLEGE